jgi:UDP-2,3-diacylglucosamine pyrophosphatase LpxH
MATTEERAHEFLIGALWQLPSIDSIKLVARLYDQRIGNTDARIIYIFLGDMHIVSRAKIGARYTANLNHERMFVEVLKKVRALKRTQTEHLIRVIQLGDFVDLWKENATDPRPVLQDYQGVRDYLYGLGRQRSVNCQFVLGNHDIEIAQIPELYTRWAFRRFISVNGTPIIYATHGDVFSWIEQLPDALQKWAVYHFSPKAPKPRKGLGDIIELRKHQDHQTDLVHVSQIGTLSSVPLEGIMPQVNISQDHRFLRDCFDRVDEMNRKYQCAINAAVIGHTHDAQIAVLEEGNKFFALLDCGAWFGTYQAAPNDVRPNCQIGVICGNDFRVYQLDADPTRSPQFESQAVL